MPEQSKTPHPEWTEAQLAILNKYLPQWLESKEERPKARASAWAEVKKTLEGFTKGGPLPDGYEILYKVRLGPLTCSDVPLTASQRLVNWFNNRRVGNQRSVLPAKILSFGTWHDWWAHQNADKIKQIQLELGRHDIGGYQMAKAMALEEADSDELEAAEAEWQKLKDVELPLETQIE